MSNKCNWVVGHNAVCGKDVANDGLPHGRTLCPEHSKMRREMMNVEFENAKASVDREIPDRRYEARDYDDGTGRREVSRNPLDHQQGGNNNEPSAFRRLC